MSGQQGFKDNFSAVAGGYSRFRPNYPEDLFEWLAAIAPRRDVAWDCACGSGQASVGLAAQFGRVFATDASAAQIAQAETRGNISYGVAAAESTAFDDGSFDLILAAQAAHWFDHDAFFAEVKRVGREDGALVLAAYELHRVAPEIDDVTDRFYEPVLGPYWHPERHHIKCGYRDIAVPFEEIEVPQIVLSAEWTADDCIGYLDTWSSISRFREATGNEPLAEFVGPMRAAWGRGTSTVRWPLILRAGRIGS